MPPLVNPRHETFAQLRASGLTWGNAYTQSGFKRANGNRGAIELLRRHPEIRDRVAEIMLDREKEANKLSLYTREEVIRGLLLNAKLGQEGTPKKDGTREYHLQASNRAFELLGLELNMFPKVNKTKHGKLDPLDGLTSEEGLELVAGMFKQILPNVDIDLEMLKGVAKLTRLGDGSSSPGSVDYSRRSRIVEEEPGDE